MLCHKYKRNFQSTSDYTVFDAHAMASTERAFQAQTAKHQEKNSPETGITFICKIHVLEHKVDTQEPDQVVAFRPLLNNPREFPNAEIFSEFQFWD